MIIKEQSASYQHSGPQQCIQRHSIPTHTPTTRLGHRADCNLPIHKPAIRLDTTFKLCEVRRHVHWQHRLIFFPLTSPYPSTSTWSHHVLYNQSHTVIAADLSLAVPSLDVPPLAVTSRTGEFSCDIFSVRRHVHWQHRLNIVN